MRHRRFPSRASARPRNARRISSAPRWSKCTAKPRHFSRGSSKARPKAKSRARYLEDRGLDREAIARFGIGYAPSGGDALLRHLKAKYADKLLEVSGLISRDPERAPLRPFPPPHHVSHRQRSRESGRFRRPRPRRRPAQISELARDSHLFQEHRAVPHGPRQGSHPPSGFRGSRGRLHGRDRRGPRGRHQCGRQLRHQPCRSRKSSYSAVSRSASS